MAPASPTGLAPQIRSAESTPKKSSVERNIQNVVLGDVLFKTWYPSFYPEELVGRSIERLLICPWCFKYSKELMPFLGHMKLCPLKTNPALGRLVYTKDCYSIHEVDGEVDKLYTQNLSLFAKLFLDNKSVFYDVSSFLYYVLLYTPPSVPRDGNNSASTQVVGFFSKEKMSWDNNNLACILVFPPWQRRGLGKVLIGASYELSRQEGNMGGPEKPLSNLGKRGYVSFWSATVARYILSVPAKKAVTIKEISDNTYIVYDDVITALKAIGVVEVKKRGDLSAVVNKAKVREWAQTSRADLAQFVDPNGFV